MHRLMTRLVRQKQLNETYVVNDEALRAFSVKTSSDTMTAKSFLEQELERIASLEEASGSSIEKETMKAKRNDNVAEPLRPDQIRPQSQASLFHFDQPLHHRLSPAPCVKRFGWSSTLLRRKFRISTKLTVKEIRCTLTTGSLAPPCRGI